MSSRTIPIIRLYDTLIVSIQIELSDLLVLELKENIADEIQRGKVVGLIIEVSGVDILDSYIARSIRDIAMISRLMGVRTVLAGLDAGMAITLVEMGILLTELETALNLEMALEVLLDQGDGSEFDRLISHEFDDDGMEDEHSFGAELNF